MLRRIEEATNRGGFLAAGGLKSARVAARDCITLRSLELLARLDQPLHIELPTSRELVHRPGRDGWLLQLTEASGDRALALVPEATSEVVAKLDELVERRRVEAIELGLFVDQAACLCRLRERELPLRGREAARFFFAVSMLAFKASIRSAVSAASSSAGATWTSFPCCFAFTTFLSAAV